MRKLESLNKGKYFPLVQISPTQPLNAKLSTLWLRPIDREDIPLINGVRAGEHIHLLYVRSGGNTLYTPDLLPVEIPTNTSYVPFITLCSIFARETEEKQQSLLFKYLSSFSGWVLLGVVDDSFLVSESVSTYNIFTRENQDPGVLLKDVEK